VECLKVRALSSNPSTAKNKEKALPEIVSVLPERITVEL
jgi:hypothetical protein